MKIIVKIHANHHQEKVLFQQDICCKVEKSSKMFDWNGLK